MAKPDKIRERACELLSICACWHQYEGAWGQQLKQMSISDRVMTTIVAGVGTPEAAIVLAISAFMAAPANGPRPIPICDIYAEAEAMIQTGWRPDHGH